MNTKTHESVGTVAPPGLSLSNGSGSLTNPDTLETFVEERTRQFAHWPARRVRPYLLEFVAANMSSLILDRCEVGAGSRVRLPRMAMVAAATFLAVSISFAAEWEMLNPETLPTKRHEAAFVELDDKFYLLGGRGIKPVEVYDPATNRWEKKSRTPIELHHFQALAHDGKIYVIGAFTGPYPNEKPVPVFHIYDPKKDEWSTGAEIPESRRRGSAGVVMHGGKTYVVCGIVSGHQGDFVPWLDSYDPKTGEWQVLPDAPHARDHFQASVVDGQIVSAAGRTSSGWTKQVFELTVPQVDVYDIATKKWRTLDKPIPTPRAGNMAITIGEDVIVLGGESGTQLEAHNEVESLNVESGHWKVLSRLITGRHGTGVAYWNGALYTAAGCANRGGSPEQNSTEKLIFK